ncbi:MAG: M14 family metallopeptidase [Acidobacteriota bacterium]
MRIAKLILFLILTSGILIPNVLTVPEKTDYKETSLYPDVMNFLFKMKNISSKINIVKLCSSTEGRMIPLVIISNESISSPYEKNVVNKPAILIMGNIHAGEVEGKEASQMMIRDFAEGKFSKLLENQIILFIPVFNADGNEKLGKNRRDNGPELAGIRPNGQNLDMNRDYIKIETPEVKALINLFNTWDPVLFVDLHTTNGSYHQEPVTYTTLSNPNSSEKLMDFMWEKMFPEVQKIMKTRFNTYAIPYGNFVDRSDPSKGWRNHAYEARFGTNYAGLRNRFTILDENYSHADFKTRVLSSYYFIRSILEFTNININTMVQITRNADIHTMKSYRDKPHSLSYKTEKLKDFTIKSYVFKKEKIKPGDRHKYPPWIKDFLIKKTDKLKDYKVTYYAKAKPEKTVDLPSGYFILPYQNKVISNLKNHGIIVEKLKKSVKGKFENFKIKKIEYAKRLYQGHILLKVEGSYKKEEITLPAGSCYVSLKQPLARLIAEILEPESKDSLLTWGFFNKKIVKQWSSRPGTYPVYRYKGKVENFISYQE